MKKNAYVLLVNGVPYPMILGDSLDLTVEFDVDDGRAHLKRVVNLEVCK